MLFTGRIAVRRAAVFCSIALISLVAWKYLPAQDLTKLSDKDLFKLGEQMYKAGKLEEARGALVLAFDKRTQKNKNRPKPDKKFSPMLEQINNTLADRIAGEGDVALQRGDLDTCEAKLAQATAIVASPTVESLRSRFAESLTDLRKRFDGATTLAAGGRYTEALAQFNALKKWERRLPELGGRIHETERKFAMALVSDGEQAMKRQAWPEAETKFGDALSLVPGLPGAQAGIQALINAREADSLALAALEKLNVQQFEEAFRLARSATDTYPGNPRHGELIGQVRVAWAASLEEKIPQLVSANDFPGAREAFLGLRQLTNLKPTSEIVRDYRTRILGDFSANSVERALFLESLEDYSRVATAYVLRLNAKLALDQSLVMPEELKRAAGSFNRKRASQLVIAVENLSGASQTFLDLVSARVASSLERLALPDLRVRTRDQYMAAPDEDPQFQDLRPARKSATSLLSIGVSAYEAERWSSQNPSKVDSSFVSGTEKVSNPDYERVQKELEQIMTALKKAAEKDKAVTEEGWTRDDYLLKQTEANRIDRYVEKPKLSTYTYDKVDHRQKTHIELRLTIRDFFTRETIAQDSIDFLDEKSAIEQTGVHEKDVNGLRNEPVRIPSTEQMLREAERVVLEGLEKKIEEIVPHFTRRFLEEGKKALEAGRRDEAAEHFLCHWGFFRGRMSPQEAEFVSKVVELETGFSLLAGGDEFRSLVDRVTVIIPGS